MMKITQKGYLLHVIPIGDNALLDGVFLGQDAALGDDFIAHISIFLAQTNHDTLVTGTTNTPNKANFT